MSARPRLGSHLQRTRLLLILALLAAIAVAAAAILIERSPETREPVEAPKSAPEPEPSVASGEEALRSLPPREQLARAFEAAFGERGTVIVPVGEEGRSSFVEQVEFAPGKLIWPPFGPVLVSEGEVVQGAHASSGKLAVHYLDGSHGAFRVTRSVVPAVETGSFGRVGDWRISDDFIQHPVLVAEGGGTWQGYSCSWVTLAALAPEGVVELARLPLSYSDAGAVGDEKSTRIEGRIANVVKGRSFDVVYSGTRAFTEHYERQGSAYVRAGGPSQMREC